jgi:hypothetical protein
VIAFARDKYFGVIGMGQRGLEGNTSEYRDKQTSSIIIPTVVLFLLALVSLFNRPSRVSILSLFLPADGSKASF